MPRTPAASRLLGLAGLLLLTLSSCKQQVTWETYHNDRYGYTFPYPSTWRAAVPPSNGDGQAFISPRVSEVQIRGWAAQVATSVEALPPSNFVTDQGVRGYLKQESEPQTQTIYLSLAIQQQGIRYNLLAQAPQSEFNTYQPYFYYVARGYRLDQKPSGS
ncbi:hypothetical protein [Leptolyngbya sp. FACHB-261]|uniref:hypothetical protein n=1 Tax=Leptolyngbya sp. FACHB-261 TaxID=2692806 RepID=UPI00168906C4|nr:hypothetical protein [Leptolyngbya sp. FACHB-261]MBD2104213.1 hypothetical protein [Leptolyngbya sp. FACHB-261]